MSVPHPTRAPPPPPPRPSTSTHSPVWVLQPHVVRVCPHVVQLLARKCSVDVPSKGGHPSGAGNPFPKAGLSGWGEGGLGPGRGAGPGLLGAWKPGGEGGPGSQAVRGWLLRLTQMLPSPPIPSPRTVTQRLQGLLMLKILAAKSWGFCPPSLRFFLVQAKRQPTAPSHVCA